MTLFDPSPGLLPADQPRATNDRQPCLSALTVEQAAVLHLLERIEALETRVRSLEEGTVRRRPW